MSRTLVMTSAAICTRIVLVKAWTVWTKFSETNFLPSSKYFGSPRGMSRPHGGKKEMRAALGPRSQACVHVYVQNCPDAVRIWLWDFELSRSGAERVGTGPLAIRRGHRPGRSGGHVAAREWAVLCRIPGFQMVSWSILEGLLTPAGQETIEKQVQNDQGARFSLWPGSSVRYGGLRGCEEEG
jgi:hypothetical protein